MSERTDLKAEVERLNAQVKRIRDEEGTIERALDAEIERLRARDTAITEDLDRKSKECAEWMRRALRDSQKLDAVHAALHPDAARGGEEKG